MAKKPAPKATKPKSTKPQAKAAAKPQAKAAAKPQAKAAAKPQVKAAKKVAKPRKQAKPAASMKGKKPANLKKVEKVANKGAAGKAGKALSRAELAAQKAAEKAAAKAAAKIAEKAAKEAAKEAKRAAKAQADAAAREAKAAQKAAEKAAERAARAVVTIPEEPDQAEEVILTDADGRRFCRVRDCDRLSEVDNYCRFHYILLWKNIQTRRNILQEGKLGRYIEELTARYPDKFLEILKKDLRSEKDFLAAIQELEIDESAVEAEFDDEESQSDIFEVQRMSDTGGGGARSEEDDRF